MIRKLEFLAVQGGNRLKKNPTPIDLIAGKNVENV